MRNRTKRTRNRSMTRKRTEENNERNIEILCIMKENLHPYHSLTFAELIDIPSSEEDECILKCNQIRMKQLYRVPFERNSDRVKQLCYEYTQVSYTVLID